MFLFNFIIHFWNVTLKYGLKKKTSNEYCQPQTCTNLHWKIQLRPGNAKQTCTMSHVRVFTISNTAYKQINLNKLFTNSQIHTFCLVNKGRLLVHYHLINLLCTFWAANKIFLVDAFWHTEKMGPLCFPWTF